jgi:hypothetical protein
MTGHSLVRASQYFVLAILGVSFTIQFPESKTETITKQVADLTSTNRNLTKSTRTAPTGIQIKRLIRN